MGMILKGAGLAALVLAAVWLPLRRQEGGEVFLGREDLIGRFQKLSEEQQSARVRWTALAERDSVLALVAKTGKPGPAPIIHLRGFPAGARAVEAEATVAGLWKTIRTVDSSVAVALYIYNEAAYPNLSRWANYRGNLITQRGGVTWCVAIAPGELRANERVLVGQVMIDWAMAPCALLAAFGPPGPGVGAWLAATRYTAARSNNWLTRSRTFVDGNGSGPWEWLYDRSEGGFGWRGGLSRILGQSALQVSMILSPPYHYGAPGLRCLDNHEPSCVEAVLHSAITTGTDPGLPPDLTVSPRLLRPPQVTLATARPPAGFFLSDMIRDLGPERFRALWKSKLPFDAAFQASLGESLGAWTSRWARRQWLASQEAKFMSKTIILGTDLAPSWPFLALGWTALALGGLGWAARRRQVT